MLILGEVRTISLNESFGHDNPANMAIIDSKSRRNRDVKHLTELLPLRQKQLDKELQQTSPSSKRVAILRRIVCDLQQTVNATQRQR